MAEWLAEWRNGGLVERQMAEYLDDGRAEWQNCGGMTELQKWRDGGIAEMAGWAEWAE